MTLIKLDHDNYASASKDGVIISHLVWNSELKQKIYEKIFIPFDKVEEIRTEIIYENQQERP